MGKPWDRQAEEASRWYDRFHEYLMMGPTRTIEGCYRRRMLVEAELRAPRVSSRWYQHAREWDWEARASAYDASFRERIASTEEDRRLWARERRRDRAEELWDFVMAGIRRARLDAPETDDRPDVPDDQKVALTAVQARRLLPVFRAWTHDLFVIDRLEMGEPTVIDHSNVVLLTSDDWAEAQAKSEEFNSHIAPVGSHGITKGRMGDSEESETPT